MVGNLQSVPDEMAMNMAICGSAKNHQQQQHPHLPHLNTKHKTGRVNYVLPNGTEDRFRWFRHFDGVPMKSWVPNPVMGCHYISHSKEHCWIC